MTNSRAIIQSSFEKVLKLFVTVQWISIPLQKKEPAIAPQTPTAPPNMSISHRQCWLCSTPSIPGRNVAAISRLQMRSAHSEYRNAARSFVAGASVFIISLSQSDSTTPTPMESPDTAPVSHPAWCRSSPELSRANPQTSPKMTGRSCRRATLPRSA